MGYGVKIEVWGEYALFTRPEFKVERVSYDVITPSAARGLLEAIYWKPAIRYVIDRIHVLNQPEFTNIRRNEVASTIKAEEIAKLMQGKKGKTYIARNEDIQQRASLVLRNVRYILEAHFEMTEKAGAEDNEKKHYNILLRRLRNGQMFHQPYFGCREFPANFRLIEESVPKSEITGERDLGFMLYDMDFTNVDDIKPGFFRARMKNGIIDLGDVEVLR